jgi:hypothetical protein
LRQHALRAHQVQHHLPRKSGFGGAVDGGRVVAFKLKRAAGPKRGAGVLRDIAHALLHHVQHRHAEGAHRALDLAHIGHHVGGLAGVDHRHRHHRSFHRLGVAAHYCLQRQHQLARHRHRVDGVVWHGSVPALAPEGDLEFVARCHHRPGTHGKRAFGQPRPVVQPKHRFHRKPLEQPIVHHAFCSATTFLCGLEDQVHRSIEIALLCQRLGRAQQHGGVAIVAAAVHLAGVLAGVGKGVEFRHGQRVHIGAQAHRTATGPAIAAMYHRHYAGLAQSAVRFNAPLRQLAHHHVGGTHLLKTQLGVGVQVASQGGQRVRGTQQGLVQSHGLSLVVVAKPHVSQLEYPLHHR